MSSLRLDAANSLTCEATFRVEELAVAPLDGLRESQYRPTGEEEGWDEWEEEVVVVEVERQRRTGH